VLHRRADATLAVFMLAAAQVRSPRYMARSAPARGATFCAPLFCLLQYTQAAEVGDAVLLRYTPGLAFVNSVTGENGLREKGGPFTSHMTVRLPSQFLQQRLGLLPIGSVKARGESAVGRREQLARFGPLTLLLPQAPPAFQNRPSRGTRAREPLRRYPHRC
jgi:hypothetical protein